VVRRADVAAPYSDLICSHVSVSSLPRQCGQRIGFRRTPKRVITPLAALTLNDLENCLPYTHEHALTEIIDSYYRHNKHRAPEHRQFRIPLLDGKRPGKDIVRERLNEFGQQLHHQRFGTPQP
jgi:hypothetical protein